jgi:hypothetical protein
MSQSATRIKTAATLAGLAACLATAAVSAPAVASAPAKHCPNLSHTVGLIRATGVSCSTAESVVRGSTRGSKKPDGFSCHAKPYQGGASISCTKGHARVTFSVAD